MELDHVVVKRTCENFTVGMSMFPPLKIIFYSFNLKIIFKNKFQKTLLNRLMFSYYFKKLIKKTPHYSLKVIFYFTLFLKIISKEQ